MKRLLASCPICGPVEVPVTDAVIDTVEGEYIFVCPHCSGIVKRQYNGTVYNLLRGAGVALIEEIPDILEEVWKL